MNPCLVSLFNDSSKRHRLTKGLPVAFDMVRNRFPRSNPAVGVLREHVILGFLESEFGKENVVVPASGIERDYDVLLCGEKLSIKTVTNERNFKILWTADTDKVKKEYENYVPKQDILLINIFWGKLKESVFYFPISVQKEIFKQLGKEKYLDTPFGTNHRGISISSKGAKAMKNHSNTMSLPVHWITENIKHPNPWNEWIEYWKNFGAK